MNPVPLPDVGKILDKNSVFLEIWKQFRLWGKTPSFESNGYRFGIISVTQAINPIRDEIWRSYSEIRRNARGMDADIVSSAELDRW